MVFLPEPSVSGEKAAPRGRCADSLPSEQTHLSQPTALPGRQEKGVCRAHIRRGGLLLGQLFPGAVPRCSTTFFAGGAPPCCRALLACHLIQGCGGPLNFSVLLSPQTTMAPGTGSISAPTRLALGSRQREQRHSRKSQPAEEQDTYRAWHPTISSTTPGKSLPFSELQFPQCNAALLRRVARGARRAVSAHGERQPLHPQPVCLRSSSESSSDSTWCEHWHTTVCTLGCVRPGSIQSRGLDTERLTLCACRSGPYLHRARPEHAG